DRIKPISLVDVIPFLRFLLPKPIKLSGIIYKIYLRAPKTGIRNLIDRFRYTVMAKSGSMGKVFILNDPQSAERLNQIYNSDRFMTLADPVPEVKGEVYDLRPKLGIPQESNVYLHFGAMDERKGTLEILHALNLMTPQELDGRTFIFAGRVNKSIKDHFCRLVDMLRKQGASIIVRDEFCTYEFLHSLCNTSDYILMPYILTDLSSGVLGYAATYGKPVIGPDSGLIGELITDNGLGLAIDISPESLKEAILCPQIYSSESGARKYIARNTRERFIEDFLGS
ncbi:MAG: glycosyltransferase, partial [Allobaculum sp.]|nr:glycosyltransferase [Allobaculum sp.]